MTLDLGYTPGQRVVEALIDGDPLTVQVERKGSSWLFTTRGARHAVRLLDPVTAKLAAHMIEKTPPDLRSEEHTSELQSLMRISYAVFCLKKTTITTQEIH